MIPAITAFWAGVPAPVKKVLTYIGIGILIFFLGKAYVSAKQHEAVVKDRAKTREKQAEVKIAVTTRQAEVLREESQSANDALEARDSGPVYATTDELPDELESVVIRRP